MLVWIQKLIDLFYNDKTGFLKDNIYIFITYGFICIGLSLVINKLLNNRNKQKQREKIDELAEKVKALEVENASLKKQFYAHGISPLVMSGTDTKPSSPSAELISSNMGNKS